MGVFFRFIGVILISLGLMALGGDVMASLERNGLVMRSLTQDLMLFNANPAEWLERTLPASVAGVIDTVMALPAFAVLGVLGLIVAALAYGKPEGEYDADDMGTPAGGWGDSGES